MKYNTRLSHNGRLVIPAECRKQLSFEPGEEMVLETFEGGLKLMSLRQAVEEIQQTIKNNKTNKKSLVDQLLEFRREDSGND